MKFIEIIIMYNIKTKAIESFIDFFALRIQMIETIKSNTMKVNAAYIPGFANEKDAVLISKWYAEA